MQVNGQRLTTLGALALSAISLTSCDAVGLAKPVNSDGSCAGSNSTACQANLGTQSLLLTVDHTLLKVGEGVSITARFNGMLMNGSGNYLPASVSDSSVLSGSAFSAVGLSVGTAVLSVSYEGTPASLTFSVVKSDDGISAFVRAAVFADGSTSWWPATAKSQVGQTVQFFTSDNTAHKHNLVFDPTPGAPADIALGATATRVFTMPGSYTFSCTVHGEAGVINIAP
jgi:plastocyanin